MQKKLALGSISLLVLSFFMIVFGRTIVSEIGLLTVLSFSWNPETLSLLILLFCGAGWFTFGVGIVSFIYLGYRSHFQIDRFAVKRQFKKTWVIAAFVLVAITLSSLFSTPMINAETTATTGYYLATPLPIADWYISKYSTGTYYAINGSNWANLMTWPSTTPWASYASNYTKVEELALAAMTYGTVYLKEVPFNYNLTIPTNVQVIENVNGLTRTFINTANSLGSPYTISVDKVNTQYYMAQDSGNRILDSWSSTNYTSTYNSALNSLTTGGSIYQQSGNYYENGSIFNSLSLGNFSLIFSSGSKIIAGNNEHRPVILLIGCNNFIIQGGTLDGNRATQDAGIGAYPTGKDPNGIEVNQCQYWTIKDVHINNMRCYGIYQQTSSIAAHGLIVGNTFSQTDCNAICIQQPNIKAVDNTIVNFCDVGITIFQPDSFVSGNTIILNANLISGVGSQNSYWGIGLEDAPFTGGIISDNTINFTASPVIATGIYANSGSGITFEGNTLIGNLIAGAGYRILTANNLIHGGSILHFNPAVKFQTGSDYSCIKDTTISTGLSGGNFGIVLYDGTGTYATTNHITISNVQFYNINYPIMDQSGDGTHRFNNTALYIYQNTGYNPRGYIANPILGTYLNDYGSTATWVSTTVYTNSGSPKTISWNVTAVSAVTFDSQSWNNNGYLTLQPTDTCSLTFADLTQANIKVAGQ